MNKKTALLTFLSLLFLINNAAAQETNQTRQQPQFFLDCYTCDFDFVRQNLRFVSFVRDSKPADVHILSSSSRTGSGGRKYYLNFIGRKEFTGKDYEYVYTAAQSDTRAEIRNGLLKLIKAGVLQYYAQTHYFNHIEIQLVDTVNPRSDISAHDPWRKWIFRIEAGSNLEKEESQNEFSIDTEFQIDKVTEEWKTRFEAEYDLDREIFYDEGKEITNRQSSIYIDAEFIKSLSPKWSAGIFANYSADTYINIENRYGMNAAIEYNIFPWDISNRKIFTFRYLAGISQYEYAEKTIYDRKNETLLHESVQLNLELIQPWGRVESRLQGRHYFHDFSKNRITLDSEVSLRLTKQLSIYSELAFEVVHDQLYLPAGGASLEDILLRRQKLATTYEIWAEFGFSFTFGSIYNNVVNERL